MLLDVDLLHRCRVEHDALSASQSIGPATSRPHPPGTIETAAAKGNWPAGGGWAREGLHQRLKHPSNINAFVFRSTAHFLMLAMIDSSRD